jgi:hypothetical protein
LERIGEMFSTASFGVIIGVVFLLAVIIFLVVLRARRHKSHAGGKIHANRSALIPVKKAKDKNIPVDNLANTESKKENLLEEKIVPSVLANRTKL